MSSRPLTLGVLLASLACGVDQSPRVLTAAQELPAGTVLTEELIAQARLAQPAEAGPGALSPSQLHSIVGRVVRVPITKGDVLHEAALAPAGAPSDLGASTPRHLRAFPVLVTGADHVRQGDRVDVLQTSTDPATNAAVVMGLLQNVVVLAVGPPEQKPAPTPFPLRQVTLQVLPEEAELLSLAEDSGLLQVLVRNPDDLDVVASPGRTTLDTVLSGERPRVLQQKRFSTIQVIRGSSGAGGSVQPEAPAATPLMDRAVASPKLGRVVFRDETGQFKPLPIKALRTLVYVEGPRARTVVDYVIENPFDRVLEGSLRYPLPQDASPAFFGTFQGALPFDVLRLAREGRSVLPPLSNEAAVTASLEAITPAASEEPALDWKTFRPARVVGRQQAAQTYERVVRGRIDPALVEWAGGNDFEARVYPIAAKSLKRVVLVYEQTLSSDGHFLHYAFPLPQTPISSFEVRLLVDEAKSAPAALSLDGEERLAAFSARAAGFSIAALELGGRAFEQELRLALKPPVRTAQFLVGKGDHELPGAFVYGRLVADFPEKTASAPTGDALFLVDTSLSEDGTRARLAGQVLRQVLERDDTITRFNVLLFDLRARWLFPAGLRENSAAARRETLAQLDAIVREGATSFESALGLLEGTPWLPAGATAFLFSDGKLTWGETNARRLLERAPRARSLEWIAYRFGDSTVNRVLFDALTASGGQLVTCLSGAQVPTAALAHRRPQLRVESIAVQGGRLHDFVVRGSPRALTPGQVIEIAGRVPGGQGPSAEIVATGSLDGVPITLRWPFVTQGQDLLAGRAWAELHVERLLALESSRVDKLVIALSQHFGLTNRLASLIVLETDAEYVQYDLKKEQVPVSEVEALTRTSLLGGEELPAGLDPAALSQPVRAFLAQLPSGARTDPLALLSHAPGAGGEARAKAEAVFLEARKRSPEDLLVFHAIGQIRLQAGDALGAARAISCVVELRPEDPEAMRLTGFVLLAQGLAQPAAEILGHLRATRTFEVQPLLEEALALVEAGRIADAALNYELALARKWDRHQRVVEAARHHYAQWLRRLLGDPGLSAAQREAVAARHAELSRGLTPPDLQITLHWNVDDIDLDLWVTDPHGERTWFEHKDSSRGGHLFWDETQGYGPELFHQPRARKGQYLAQVHYYGNNSEQWAIPAVVLGVLDRYPNDAKRHSRRFKALLLRNQGTSEAELFRAEF